MMGNSTRASAVQAAEVMSVTHAHPCFAQVIFDARHLWEIIEADVEEEAS
jgi:hypothetical protein